MSSDPTTDPATPAQPWVRLGGDDSDGTIDRFELPPPGAPSP